MRSTSSRADITLYRGCSSPPRSRRWRRPRASGYPPSRSLH